MDVLYVPATQDVPRVKMDIVMTNLIWNVDVSTGNVKMMNRLLSSTSNCMVYGEVGKLPIQISVENS